MSAKEGDIVSIIATRGTLIQGSISKTLPDGHYIVTTGSVFIDPVKGPTNQAEVEPVKAYKIVRFLH